MARSISYPGKPATSPELVGLIVRLARENSSWGYDRIAGALSNLGHKVSDQTVGSVLRRHGIAPAPKRTKPPHGRTSSPHTWL
jgi:transposase